MESDELEKLFQDAFENFEVTPPVSAKLEIDNKLGIKKKGRFVFWVVPILLLLLAAVTFVVSNISTHSTSTKHQFSSDSQQVLVQSDQDTSSTSDSEEINATDNGTVGELKKSSVKQEEQGSMKTEQKTDAVEQQLGSVQQKQGRTKIQTGSSEQMNKLKLEKIDSKQTKKSVRNNLKINKRNELAGFFQKKKSSGNDSGIYGVRTIDSPVESKVLDKKEEKQEINLNEAKVVEPKQLEDSISKVADEIKTEKTAAPDSTVNELNSVQNMDNSTEVEQPKANSGKAQNWMIELYGGPRFGLKTSKSDFTLKESSAYQIGLGFSRKLNLGPLKYVTFDGEYGAGKETYHQEITTNSIYFAGIDSVPYFDPVTDSIIGYNYYNNYDTLTTKIEKNTNALVTRFAFGLRAQFNFDLGKGFGIGVVPGYSYSMSKFRFSDSANTTLSGSSSQISLGLSVYYDWNRFRFRIGLDSRYELMGKNQNAFIDRRKSVLFSPQLGIAFKF